MANVYLCIAIVGSERRSHTGDGEIKTGGGRGRLDMI